MNKSKEKSQRRETRHRRIRARVAGSASRPRLCIFKSNRAFYAQIIDDTRGNTLAAGTDSKSLLESAKKAGIKNVVFDRGGFNYTGRVREFADEVRKGGLEF
ncbi:MAG TPA: 50S ribosomal protein L18 [Candidatus Paceibacterota bacterium]